jgi:hypothetical protein
MHSKERGTEREGQNHVLFRELVKEITSTTYGPFGLFRYPAKFILQVIAYIIKKYVDETETVFDPFAGFGTVGLISRIYGHGYELWDLNPMLEYFHDASTAVVPEEFNPKTIISDSRVIDFELRLIYSNYPPVFF